MWNADKLYQKRLERDDAGLGFDLGDGYSCFVDKLLTGEWKISKLNSKDNVVYIRILPANIGKILFKKTLAEMLEVK